jgi:hypothetical protein
MFIHFLRRRFKDDTNVGRYREAIPILYSSNTFLFSEHGNVHLFLESLLPQRRQLIRKIRAEIISPSQLDSLFWKRAELYRLNGLGELRVYVGLNYWCHDTTNLSNILKIEIPVKMNVFQIWVPEKFCVPDEGFQMHGGGEIVLVRNNRFM